MLGWFAFASFQADFHLFNRFQIPHKRNNDQIDLQLTFFQDLSFFFKPSFYIWSKPSRFDS